MKVFLKTLGCAKNDVDSDHLITYFKDHSFSLTKVAGRADIAIINTCGFILPAKEESISAILGLAALKKKKLKALIVFGCLAKRYFAELSEDIPEVDLFVPSTIPQEVAAAISGHLISKGLLEKARVTKAQMDATKTAGSKAQKSALKGRNYRTKQSKSYAYLKIADGCSSHCSYCAIPLIKGPFISRPMGEILDEAKELSAGGVKELILIAQDTAAYGLDLPGSASEKPSLAKLISELDQLDITGIRVLYQKPESIKPKLLQAFSASSKFIPYFDIPIQHLSEPIVRKMNRRSGIEHIEKLFAQIREKFPGATLRSSVIVGFPSESDEDLELLLAGLARIKFDFLSVFPYSPEEGTKAEKLKPRVDAHTISERVNRVLDLQDRVLGDKNRERTGRETILTIDKRQKFSALSEIDRQEMMSLIADSASKKSVFAVIIGHSPEKVPDTDGNIYLFVPDEASYKEMKVGLQMKVKIMHCDGYDIVAEPAIKRKPPK